MPHLLILNGPNLNLLGSREQGIYGHASWAEVVALCQRVAAEAGVTAEVQQSNHEGALVDWIQTTKADGILINAAAFTHTSIALRDALLARALPYIELHLSNVHAREPFRHHSMLADKALGVITGFGADSYRLAILAMVAKLGRS